MFPTNSPIPLNSKALVVQDVNRVDSTNYFASSGNESPNGVPPMANSFSAGSKRLQEELERVGSKMKKYEDNIKFLKIQRNQLDDVILDLQVSLGKSTFSGASETQEDGTAHGRSVNEVIKQIMTHELSAAGIYYSQKDYQNLHNSHPTLSQEVLGVVATLGKVDDDNLCRLFSEYLGLQTMLAFVCKTHEGIQALEMYDNEGLVSKGLGIHGVGTAIGRAVQGRFLVICLDNLRPYAGEIIEDDPQRRLDIPKPRLPSGDIPEGFLGFAVNMVHVDRKNLFCSTSSGSGLRETLFYHLFARLQVYRTRAEMLRAVPCISDGAASLDGGMIRATGVFSLGNREEVGVNFPKCTKRDGLPDKYYALESQLKKTKWEKERLNEDIRRAQALLDQEKFNFSLKKQEFLKFLADSSSILAQHQFQSQTAARDRQSLS